MAIKKGTGSSSASSFRSKPAPKPRAYRSRMPGPAQDIQAEERLDEQSSGASVAGGKRAERTDSSRRPDSRQHMDRPDNVSLSLSPKMLELAEELADQARMPLRVYLTEALKHIILIHGKRLGKTERYLPEFTSQNKRRTTSWQADSTESVDAPTSRGLRQSGRSQGEGRQFRRVAGDKPRTDISGGDGRGKRRTTNDNRGISRTEGDKQQKSGQQSRFSRLSGQSSGDQKRGQQGQRKRYGKFQASESQGSSGKRGGTASYKKRTRTRQQSRTQN